MKSRGLRNLRPAPPLATLTPQYFARRLDAVAVDAEALPVRLAPEQEGNPAMRRDVVEYRGWLGVAHGADRVVAQEPYPLTPEACVARVEITRLGVASVGVRLGMNPAE